MTFTASLVIGQAWSLGVELTFIVLAPFLMRNRTLFWLAVLVSSWIAYHYILQGRPQYGVSTSIYFLLGAIGYKFYRRYLKEMKSSPLRAFIGYYYVAWIGLMLFYYDWLTTRFGDVPVYFASMGFVVLTVPFIATFTKGLKLDFVIGQLSYPIYLGHFTIFAIVARLQLRPHFTYVVLLCFLWALGCYLLIDRPLADYRRRKIAAPAPLPRHAEAVGCPEFERA